jgi:high-affinity iron transporter
MIGNYLIGLREGLEAALVVSILLVYLTRTNRAAMRHWVFFGVGSAIVASILVALILETISKDLSATAEPAFAGIVSFAAVAFVTWMIFWMRRSARTISTDLRNQLDDAALGGGHIAVAAMAFVAVIREGAETAVFFWAASQASGNTLASTLGLVLGLATAVALGWAIYRSSASINLPKFFRITGILLVFVAAGVLSYGIHEFQEIGWLPGEDDVLINLSGVLAEGSVLQTLVAGIFNIKATTTTLQALAWMAYSIVVLFLFLRPVTAAPLVRTENAVSDTNSQVTRR